MADTSIHRSSSLSSSYSKQLREGFFQSHFTDKQLIKSKVTFRNVCLTAAYFLVLLSYGFSVGVIGPTLPVLSNVSTTPTSKMGWIFTMKGLGVILGSLFGGRVYHSLYGRSSRFANLLLASAVLGLTGSIGLLPIITRFSGILAAYWLYGFCAGLVIMGSNILLELAWGTTMTGLVLALNAQVGLGCALSPLMIAMGWSFNGVYSWIAGSLISSALLLSLSVLLPYKEKYAPLEEISEDYEETEELVENNEESTQLQEPVVHKKVKFADRFRNFSLVTIIGTSLFGAIAIESVFGGLLSTYLRDQNLASTYKMNTLLNSVFWLSMTVGRLGSAILSHWLSPSILLSLSANGVFASLAILFLSTPANPISTWLAVSLMGLSVSGMYPVALSYPELSMKGVDVSANISSLIMLMAASAELFVPLSVTSSLARFGPRAFIWVLLAVTSATFVSYLSMFLWSFALHYKSRPGILPREQIPLMQSDLFENSPISPSSPSVQSPLEKVVDPQRAERPATPA